MPCSFRPWQQPAAMRCQECWGWRRWAACPAPSCPTGGSSPAQGRQKVKGAEGGVRGHMSREALQCSGRCHPSGLAGSQLHAGLVHRPSCMKGVGLCLPCWPASWHIESSDACMHGHSSAGKATPSHVKQRAASRLAAAAGCLLGAGVRLSVRNTTLGLLAQATAPQCAAAAATAARPPPQSPGS